MSMVLCSCSRYPYLKRDWQKESNLGELGLENEEGKSLANQEPCFVSQTYLCLSHKFCSCQGEVVELSASKLNSWPNIEVHLCIAYLLPDNDRFSCLTFLKHTKHHTIFHIINHNLEFINQIHVRVESHFLEFFQTFYVKPLWVFFLRSILQFIITCFKTQVSEHKSDKNVFMNSIYHYKILQIMNHNSWIHNSHSTKI